MGDPPEELFPALYGLWLKYLTGNELPRAYELAEEFLRRAKESGDPALLLYARYTVGNSLYWMGEFLATKENLETAITHYDPERHRTLALRFEGYDAKLINLLMLSWVLWKLGYPERAIKRSNEARALAERLANPRDAARVLVFTSIVHRNRREIRATQESAEVVLALSTEHGITEWLAWATALRGWAIAAQGNHEEGIARIEEGIARSRGMIELHRSYFLCMLAEASMEAGRLDEGLRALRQALATADQQEERFYEAEIHRLQGELLLKQNDSKAAEAQSCFERAIEIACQQSAKSLELGATMSLAWLLANQGRREDARAMLAKIYGWFTEGSTPPT